MPLSLNTSHPLYGYLKQLICVENGVIKDLKNPSQTFTQDALAGGVVAARGYGEGFRFQNNGQYGAAVVTLGTNIAAGTDATSKTTVFLAFNVLKSAPAGAAGNLFQPASLIQVNPAGRVSSYGQAPGGYGTLTTGSVSLSDFNAPIPGTIAVCRNGTSVNMWLNGAPDAGSPFSNSSGQLDWANPSRVISTLGANNGNGTASAEVVFMAVFQGIVPTDAQIAELHASLTGAGAFSLVSSGGGTAVALSANALANAGGSSTLSVATNGALSGTGLARATVTAALTAVGTSGVQLVLPALKNNTGTLLANVTNIVCHVYQTTTGDKVVTKTGVSSDTSGIISLSDPALTAGNAYRIIVVLPSGAEGMGTVTAV